MELPLSGGGLRLRPEKHRLLTSVAQSAAKQTAHPQQTCAGQRQGRRLRRWSDLRSHIQVGRQPVHSWRQVTVRPALRFETRLAFLSPSLLPAAKGMSQDVGHLPVTARQFGEVSEYFRKRQLVKSVALAPLAGRFHRALTTLFPEGDGHLARTPSAPPECGDPEGDGQWRLRSLLP